MNSQPPHSATDAPRRILVRGVNWLGDAVMTTPALSRLRERFPQAHITLLTPRKLLDLWQHHPSINDRIAIEPKEGVTSVGRKISAGQFDLALVLPNSPRSAIEVWLARIPRRIGYARPWRNWFLTQTIPGRPDHTPLRKRSIAEIKRLVAAPGNPSQNPPRGPVHQVHDYLHLAAALGAQNTPVAPRLAVTPAEVCAIKQKFDLERIDRPILGLNPGAEYGPAKRWPADRFIAAALDIQRRTNCAWLIFGGPNETELAAKIAHGISPSSSPVHNLAGRTSLRELMALLKSCRVLLSNDTGPMHVAAALGTPVIVPFGSTSPELTGPDFIGGSPHRILRSDTPCSPCFRRDCPIDFRCMTGIPVTAAVDAVLKVLAEIPAPAVAH